MLLMLAVMISVVTHCGCVDPTMPWWETRDLYKGYRPADEWVMYQGWKIAVALIPTDLSANTEKANDFALEIRAQQTLQSQPVLLGLDSVYVMGNFFAAGGARPMLMITNCPVSGDYQYYYLSHLRRGRDLGRPSDNPEYYNVDVHASTSVAPYTDTIPVLVSLRLTKHK